MYGSLRNILALCLLAAAAAASWYLRQPAEDGAADTAASPPGTPGYYLRNAVLRRTGEDGDVLYRIHAERAEERPSDGALLLAGVRLEYRAAEQVPWHLRAAHAQALADASSLELEGDVELMRERADDGDAAVVRAQRLRLWPRRHLAHASGGVSLSIGPNTVTASALTAFLKEDRVELESNVHGRFQP